MFYHSRELKHVIYGKVDAFVERDDWLIPTYKWLSQYCGFFPQIWLSRSSNRFTGNRFRSQGILFGFDYIKGFSVDYNQWERVLMGLIDHSKGKDITGLEKQMRDYFMKSNMEDDKEGLEGKDRLFPVADYEEWRDNYLFVENDQVVTTRLNLKSTKKIICRNEREKKVLRKMGFINNRIRIMNLKKF